MSAKNLFLSLLLLIVSLTTGGGGGIIGGSVVLQEVKFKNKRRSNKIFFFITKTPFIVFKIYLILKLINPKFVFCCATTITLVMVVSL